MLRKRSRAAAHPLVRPSWASVGVERVRCGRAPVADVTITELRDQLAFTIGSLAAVAGNPAFCADIAADVRAVALYRELARLGLELAAVAGYVAGDEGAAKG